MTHSHITKETQDAFVVKPFFQLQMTLEPLESESPCIHTAGKDGSAAATSKPGWTIGPGRKV